MFYIEKLAYVVNLRNSQSCRFDEGEILVARSTKIGNTVRSYL